MPGRVDRSLTLAAPILPYLGDPVLRLWKRGGRGGLRFISFREFSRPPQDTMVILFCCHSPLLNCDQDHKMEGFHKKHWPFSVKSHARLRPEHRGSHGRCAETRNRGEWTFITPTSYIVSRTLQEMRRGNFLLLRMKGTMKNTPLRNNRSWAGLKCNKAASSRSTPGPSACFQSGILGLCTVLVLAFSTAYSQNPATTAPTLIDHDFKAGLELWATLLGRLWIPAPGSYVIKHLEWEQTVQKVYRHPDVHVQAGDIVIDCGAHIGGFTRTALREGAGLVVAIEPEQANLLAFRRNFEPEIKSAKVRLVPKGVWDSLGRLALHLSTVGDSHSVVIPQNKGADESIEVTTIDALVASLHLPRVDFIKMDIEGAEQHALQGAQQTLHRYHPRLAISSYHLKGDPAAICAIVWQARGDYLVTSKDVDENGGVQIPKVLFFYCSQ